MRPAEPAEPPHASHPPECFACRCPLCTPVTSESLGDPPLAPWPTDEDLARAERVLAVVLAGPEGAWVGRVVRSWRLGEG